MGWKDAGRGGRVILPVSLAPLLRPHWIWAVLSSIDSEVKWAAIDAVPRTKVTFHRSVANRNLPLHRLGRSPHRRTLVFREQSDDPFSTSRNAGETASHRESFS